MKVQTTEAPTNEMAMGRKINDLASDSERRPSLSARVANARPTTRQITGTTRAHSTLFRIEIRYWLSVNTL